MNVYALFADCSAERIIIDAFPQKKGENGLVIRTSINSSILKESAVGSVRNAYHILEKYINDFEQDIAIYIYGFSEKVLGDSADLAFALAFVAHLIDEGLLKPESKIIPNIAATGMIDERLNVRSIKGLKEKMVAAIDAGVEIIYFPHENLNDFEDICHSDIEFGKLVKKVKTVPVKSLEDALVKMGVIKDKPIKPVKITNFRNKQKVFVIAVLGFVVVSSSLFVVPQLFSTQNPADNTQKNTLSSSDANMSQNSSPLGLQTSQASAEFNKSNSENTVTPSPSNGSVKSSVTPGIVTSGIPTAVNSTRTSYSIQTASPTPETAKIPHSNVVNSSGNSAGNLINYGFTSIQGDDVFYADNLDIGLYCINPYTKSKTTISRSYAGYINIEGEKVFFLDKKSSIIYTVKTDGSGPARKLNNDRAGMVSVAGNWVYYTGLNDGKIYKITLDGMDRTPLCNGFENIFSNNTKNYICKYINIEGSFIYTYIDFPDSTENNGIYRMNKDGSDKTCLANVQCNNMIVDNGYVYFTSLNDKCLYRLDSGSGKKVKISIDSMNVYTISDGWIYFSNGRGIFRMLPGDEPIMLSTNICDKINVISDWIYYYSLKDGNRLYKVRTNGKDNQSVN